MNISSVRLKLASFLSIIYVLFFCFYYWFVFAIQFQQNELNFTLTNILDFVTFILFTFLFLSFNKLLKDVWQFDKVDRLIKGLIYIKLFSLIFQILFPFIPFFIWFKYVLAFLLLIATIIYITIAIKLLSIKSNLYGMRKTFCYLAIINGIGYIYYVAAPYFNRLVDFQVINQQIADLLFAMSHFAFIPKLAVYIVLAIIFFKASRKNTTTVI